MRHFEQSERNRSSEDLCTWQEVPSSLDQRIRRINVPLFYRWTRVGGRRQRLGLYTSIQDFIALHRHW